MPLIRPLEGDVPGDWPSNKLLEGDALLTFDLNRCQIFPRPSVVDDESDGLLETVGLREVGGVRSPSTEGILACSAMEASCSPVLLDSEVSEFADCFLLTISEVSV